MRLPKLLFTLAVTTMAFALFGGANARVATASDQAPAAPSCTEPVPNTLVCGTVKGSVNYDLHLPGSTTGGVSFSCNTNATKDMMGNQVIFDVDALCSHVIFSTTVFADISSVATYSAALGFNFADLVLCTVGGAPDDRCAAGPEVICDRGGSTTPDANDNQTATINCTNVPPGTYELLVDPFFFTACEVFACTPPSTCDAIVLTGSCVTGTLTVSPTSGGGGTGGVSGGATDRMTGGGHVDQVQDDNFALEVWEGAFNPKGQVRFANKATCVFRSTQLNWVMITPSATGVHAEFDGYGEVKPKSGGTSTWGHFHGYADDNSVGSDKFKLTESPGGCLNSDDTVTKGQVKAHLAS